MGLKDLIGGIVSPVTSLISEAVTDKDLKAKLEHEIQAMRANLEAAILENQAAIIMAEANGHSWLQRNIRPLCLLAFLGMLCAHWFGFTPPGITEAERLELFSLLKIGIGGYIGGRTIEKISPVIGRIGETKRGEMTFKSSN